MKTMHWRTCAFAALLPLSTLVHAAPADPTDATVGGPSSSYDSAFKTYQPATEESVTPDKGWRVANDAVAAKPGDDHMMGMQMGQPMKMPMPGMAEGFSNGTMVMPDGSTMSMKKGMKMPMPKPKVAKPKQKGVAMPMDKGMTMPDGGTMPMDKNMPMPMPRPMPKADTSMPGMDMSRGHDAKGH